ncbi:MAG: preprotein translocase subunit YajC [Actinomycetota bacterium]
MQVVVVYLVILVGAFYFLIVRPQRRQQMLRRQLLEAVGVGDEVVTNGGLFGTVVSLEPETLELEIAPGVIVKVARAAVVQKIPGGSDADAGVSRMGDEPAGDGGSSSDDGDDGAAS